MFVKIFLVVVEITFFIATVGKTLHWTSRFRRKHQCTLLTNRAAPVKLVLLFLRNIVNKYAYAEQR